MTATPDAGALYRDLVLAHARTPHNFRPMQEATHSAEGHNVLCGDRIVVLLKIEGARIADIAFQGSGCAILTASGSMMTDALSGSTVSEGARRAHAVCRWFSGAPDEPSPATPLDALGEVRTWPTRVRCATLPWKTLEAALAGAVDSVSTDTGVPG